MKFFKQLNGLGKFVICIFILAIVGAVCWLGGLFNELGLQSPIVSSKPSIVDADNSVSSISSSSNSTAESKPMTSTDKITISLDEWIG